MLAAEMTSRLKAAEPTMVDAPNSPGHPPRFEAVSITARRISGAEEPRAMSVRFATVEFHTRTFFCSFYDSPWSSTFSTVMNFVVEVIFSIDSMKMSETTPMPMNR